MEIWYFELENLIYSIKKGDDMFFIAVLATTQWVLVIEPTLNSFLEQKTFDSFLMSNFYDY